MLSENCNAISNVKKFGNVQFEQRDQIAKDIWEFVTNMNSWLSISFIPGVLNKDAYLASRVIDCRTEWTIPLHLFKQICIHLEFLLQIDLFASRLNYRLKRFYSYSSNPKCKHVDSFSVPWNEDSYAFPSIILLNRTLQKVEQDCAILLLIVPFWPNQPFFSNMLQLAVTRPLLLPDPPPIYLPWDKSQCHPNSHNHHFFPLLCAESHQNARFGRTGCWKIHPWLLHPHSQRAWQIFQRLDGIHTWKQFWLYVPHGHTCNKFHL